MCGRFVLLANLDVIAESFDVQHVACHYQTGSSISPGQQVAAVIRKDHQNVLVNFRWGLIPCWAKSPSIGSRMFNARSETLHEKPSFKTAFRERRCLIVADGFFEWQKQEKGKTPFLFSLKSGDPFGFAGLYESWRSPDNQKIHSCTIITAEANEVVKPIHDRMPVIIEKEHEPVWLNPDCRDQKALLSMLKSYPAEKMKME